MFPWEVFQSDDAALKFSRHVHAFSEQGDARSSVLLFSRLDSSEYCRLWVCKRHCLLLGSENVNDLRDSRHSCRLRYQ